MALTSPRRLLASPPLVIAVAAVCCSAALAMAGGLPLGPGKPAHARTAAASGVFAQSNSRDGTAILSATAMRPGTQVSGDVTIANAGDIPGAFTLGQSDLVDLPGAGGGVLSSRLQLEVLDISNPAAPAAVWSGALGGFPLRELGAFAPGQARTYRFTATFPDGGGGADNPWAGSSTSVRFVWSGTGETPPPTPTPKRAPGGAAPSVTLASVPGGVVRLAVPSGCVRRGGTFRTTLSWKKQKRKGNVFVKVRRTDFFVGSRRILLDRKAPFSARFKVPLSAVPGSTLTVRARAYIKVRRGKSPKKSIRATVRVCP